MNDSVESVLTFRLQTLCVLLVLTLSYGGFCVFVRMVWTAWQKLIQDYNIRDVVIFRYFLLSFSGIEIHLSASVNDLMCVSLCGGSEKHAKHLWWRFLQSSRSVIAKL